MKNFIQQFEAIILSLVSASTTPNVVLGGSNALLQHGLKMSRKVTDLDVIIYNPTQDQLKILKNLSFFDLIKDRPELQYGELQKAIKIEKGGFTLDIIQEIKTLPTDLLLLKYKEHYFPVQSIENVVEAKRSYTHITVLIHTTDQKLSI